MDDVTLLSFFAVVILWQVRHVGDSPGSIARRIHRGRVVQVRRGLVGYARRRGAVYVHRASGPMALLPVPRRAGRRGRGRVVELPVSTVGRREERERSGQRREEAAAVQLLHAAGGRVAGHGILSHEEEARAFSRLPVGLELREGGGKGGENEWWIRLCILWGIVMRVGVRGGVRGGEGVR